MELDIPKLFYPLYNAALIQQREEGRKSGWEEGRQSGLDEGRQLGWDEAEIDKGIRIFIKCKKRGMTDEDARDFAEITEEQAAIALERMQQEIDS